MTSPGSSTLTECKLSAASATLAMSQTASFASKEKGLPRQPTTKSRITLKACEDALWAALPLLFHLSGLATLLAAFLQDSIPYLELRQRGGTGRLLYGILESCWIVPGEQKWQCTGRSMHADFVPSLVALNEWIAAPASLQLPFRSSQTPAIVLTSVVFSFLSLVVYIPIWLVAYAPKTRMPAHFKEILLDHSRKFLMLVGVLSFASFVFAITIGVGYKLLMHAAVVHFERAQQAAYLYGWTGSSTTLWTIHVGHGFNLFWAGSIMQALVALGINLALHNRLDERIERQADAPTMMTSQYL